MQKPTKQHKELLALIKPLIDKLNDTGYHYFFVAGKDGTCSRYLKGELGDLHGIILGMAKNNPKLKELLIDIVKSCKTKTPCGK